MSEFNDNKGKKSMMRKLTYLIVITTLVWGSTEIIYTFFDPTFEIHQTFIVTILLIGLTGKVSQKYIEKNESKD